MNKKLLLIIILVIINSILLYGATTQIIGNSINGINYDFSSNQIHNYLSIGPYQSNLLMLRITTSQESICLFGKNPSSLGEFEGKYGTRHEKILEDLEEGINRYYIRCQNDSYVGLINEVVFSVNLPIEGNIIISEKEPPLKEGQYEIILTTSKDCLDIPELKYTLDGITYKQISLKGSENAWKGYLIIPRDSGEGVGYFTFKAKDLYGGEGNAITGDNLFIIDTIKPEGIEIINAVGYQGQIKLNWFYNSDIKEFNVYKSENPQVDYTDFYKTTTKDYFTDNSVEKGKTYYYRVAGVDNAGNIADLSQEVYATGLYSNSSITSTGLNIKLVGKVDNVISEIESMRLDVEEIQTVLNSKEEKERGLIEDLKLNKEIENAISELNSIKRDVEKYKLQDLTEEELDKKISSSSLRISIIKKKIPEDFVILDEKEITREINEENIRKSFLEYFEGIREPSKREVTTTLDIVKEKKIKLTSKFYNSEIVYMDGTKKDITIVKDFLDSEIESLENFFYILIISKDIAEKSSELEIMNSNYEVIKDDPVLSFNSDTKRITYYIEKEIDLNSLEDIVISPIQVINDESKVTGNVISDYLPNNSISIIVLIVFVSSLIIYFLVLKTNSKKKAIKEMIEDIEDIEKLIKENKKDEAKKVYLKLKEDYKELSDKNKEKIVSEFNKINETLSK